MSVAVCHWDSGSLDGWVYTEWGTSNAVLVLPGCIEWWYCSLVFGTVVVFSGVVGFHG